MSMQGTTPTGLKREDFVNALRDMDSYLDITVEDLMAVHNLAEKHARLRANEAVRVSQLMTGDVHCVHPDTPLAEAAHCLVTNRISGLPVVDNEQKLVGMLTEADFLRALGVPSHHPTHSLWQTLEAMFQHPREIREPQGLVGEMMVTDVVSVSPEQSLHDVLEAMKKHRIKRLVVCDESRRVVGMITRSDLVRLFFDWAIKQEGDHD